MSLSQRVIGVSGILTPPIRMVQQARWGLPPTYRHLQGLFHLHTGQRRLQGPPHHLPGTQIHHDGQSQPAWVLDTSYLLPRPDWEPLP